MFNPPVCWVVSILLVSCSLFLHDFCFILFLSSLVPEAPSAYDVGCVHACVCVLFSPVKYSSLRSQVLLFSSKAHLRTSISQSHFLDCLGCPLVQSSFAWKVGECMWCRTRHRGLKSPGAPEGSVNTDGSGSGPLHHQHSARLWGPCLGLVLLPLWTYIDSYLQTVMPNRSSLCPHFTDPFPRWEVWSQGLSRQAGLWSVLPPLVTLSLPKFS